MYAIIVYDVGKERIEKLRNFLRKYLYWIQNSVFEGEISEYELKVIQQQISEILDDGDSIVIYIFRSNKEFKRLTMGSSKGTTDMIF